MSTDDTGLRRVGVNLDKPSGAALDHLVKSRGESMTKIISHALRLLSLIQANWDEGGELTLRKPDGSLVSVMIL